LNERTEVGVEMIARPAVLVLDEPTSGLDDYGARFTMKLVLEYVKSEMTTVIIVIHQPAEAVFNLFDRCLLLGKGRVCYFGETKTAGDYFASMGHPTPPLMNPIEHFCKLI
jgi:ABC-type multidrug transport system ATPase subunit